MSLTAEIAEAVADVEATLAAHPERNGNLAEAAVLRGEPRPYPALYLGRGPDTAAGEVLERREPPAPRPPEQRVLDAVRGMTWPLRMHNPIRPRFGLGKGTGSLPASFGIELDAGLGYTPRGARPLATVVAEGLPDPLTSGIIPELREDIEAIKALTPPWLQISPPDMQGPFNIAHMVLGDDAMLAPLVEPELFAEFMTIVTEFYITLAANLRCWIGPERYPTFPGATTRIAECSVNMISPALYLEHVLPYDLRIVEAYGEAAIHPCSGPHVFYATLRNLPNVVYQEAGFIAQTAAGSIAVDDALAAIGDRPIVLAIGQELPEGEEEDFIRRDLDRARDNHRLLFGYTGMHWRVRDEAAMRDMHLRLDEYWREHVWETPCAC